MQNPIRNYFTFLRVDASEIDPTVPFDNEFYLLGVSESETDDEVAQKAKLLSDARSQYVGDVGQKHASKRLDILLRDKINQAGLRFNGQPTKVQSHRDDLQKLRDSRLKEFAKALGDSGKWTEQQGAEILESIAALIRIPAGSVKNSVAGALKSAGQWPPDRRLLNLASALRASGKWTDQQGGDLLETIAPALGIPGASVTQSVADALRSAGTWPPEGRVKDIATGLCTSGKWTELQGGDLLETIAPALGVPAADVAQSVADALRSVGPWPPERRLKDIASQLHTSRKWTGEQSRDLLEGIAHPLGIPPADIGPLVADALQAVGPWPPSAPQSPGPQDVSPPPSSQMPVDNIAVARWRFSIWYAILLVGVVLEVINRWAGLAYGLAFVLLAAAKGMAERQTNSGALRKNLIWGGLNAGLAGILGVIGLVTMLVGSGAETARATWAGEWDTDWGKMVIIDGQVPLTATYESRTGSGRAEFRLGRDKDNQATLNGKWCLGTSCDTAEKKGLLLLVMSKDGRSFDGYFTYSLEGKVEANDSSGNVIVGRRKSAQ